MNYPFSRTVLFGLCALLLTGSSKNLTPDDRPNILLIVADDLGYSDLGVYGSDIRTPNIDALASAGILFTQFHTAPLCAPTRAMLMSGNNNHVAGVALQWASGVVRDNLPGYEGHLSDRVAPFPKLLREAGYNTYASGKWHLGTEAEHSPAAAGFKRSFMLAQGGANHFNSTGFYEGGSIYREDGVEVEYPDGKYSTEVYTDRLIEFIEFNRSDGRPFFAYAAYTSPHWPLQVPDDYLDRYEGRYDAGYDALREQRFTSLKRAGIIPESSMLPPRNEGIKRWEDLDPEERRHEARKMELYAAMVENLDHHVGRLIDYLKSAGLHENTILVFMSDNGAAAEDFYNVGGFVPYIRAHYENAYENMGKASSWVSYGPQWAEAGSAPFRRHKGYATQGGIVAPMIISGPGITHKMTNAYVTVMDLAPTFIQLAGAAYPSDGSVQPMRGESMVDLLTGNSAFVHGSDYVTALSHAGRVFIRQGKWKLLTVEPPFDESKFELYDVEADAGEAKNLAQTNPEKFNEMIHLWRETRRELGIVVPSDL